MGISVSGISSQLAEVAKAAGTKSLNAIEKRLGPAMIDTLESTIPSLVSFVALSSLLGNSDRVPFFIGLAVSVFGGLFMGGSSYQGWKENRLNQEIQKIKTASRANPKKALILQSKDDLVRHVLTPKCSRSYVSNLRSLAETHFIEVVYIDTQASLDQALASIANDAVDTVWIRSDLKGSSIELGADWSVDQNSPLLANTLQSKLKQNAFVILENISCRKNDVGMQLSTIFPKAAIFTASQGIHPFNGLEINRNGVPDFNDGLLCKGKKITQIYQKGENITSTLFRLDSQPMDTPRLKNHRPASAPLLTKARTSPMRRVQSSPNLQVRPHVDLSRPITPRSSE